MALEAWSPHASVRHDVMQAAGNKGVKMTPESRATVHSLPFLSVPLWDISDEEISEGKRTPAVGFAAYAAECIRDGRYGNGQELYPAGSGVYREITRESVDQAMELLAER